MDNPTLNPSGIGLAATQVADSFTILSLLSLHEVWSSCLSQQTDEQDFDFEGLIGLANMMYKGIYAVDEIVDRFRQSLETLSNEFVDNALTATEHVADERGLGKWPFASGFDGVNMREWLISACQFVQIELGSERDVLGEEGEVPFTRRAQ